MILEERCRDPDKLEGCMIKLDGALPDVKKIGQTRKTGFAVMAGYDYILTSVYEMAPQKANAYHVYSVSSEAVVDYYRLNKKQIDSIREKISEGEFPLTIEANPLTLKERNEQRRAKEESLRREISEAEFCQQLKDDYWAQERSRWRNRARSL